MKGKERGEAFIEIANILDFIWKDTRADNMADLANKGLNVQEMKAFERGYLTAASEARATGNLVILANSETTTEDQLLDALARQQAEVQEINGL